LWTNRNAFTANAAFDAEGAAMNLEYVEQRCLKYLKQHKNPLLPFESLLKHCKEDEACEGIDEKVLLDFLRNHAEVRVLYGPGEGDALGADIFAAAGLMLGTRIIHRDRVPSQAELGALMKEHASGIIETLEKALAASDLAKDPKRKEDLDAALARARDMRDKLQKML